MNKVCLILPYFGKWPPYFNIYLKSCEYNKTLDFLFFTNIQPPNTYPENVKFVSTSLSEVNILFNDKLGFTSSLTNPYKLCDLKPAYGFLFQEYIKNYEYWGFGDIDLVLGNVADFIETNRSNDYDIISLRKEWCSGSFSLFKNIAKVNRLFMADQRYIDVFVDVNYCGFDECGKLFDRFKKGLPNLNDFNLPPNFSVISWKAGNEKDFSVHFETLIKESIKPDELIYWEKGKIYGEGVTYLLYHYITEKRKYYFSYPNWTRIPDKFFIDDTGFYLEGDLKWRFLIRFARKIKGIYRFSLDIISRFKKKYLQELL